MGERAKHAVRAALTIHRSALLLIPMRTWLRSVTHVWTAPRILVVVRVHARLPVVLHGDWAPRALELVHEEVVRQIAVVRLPMIVDRRGAVLLQIIPGILGIRRMFTP